MKKLWACLPLLIVSNAGFAETAIDFHRPAPSDNSSKHFIIKHGNLKDTDDFLVNPICTGPLQSPALITDLNAFFDGYAGTRVIERGNGHYLLVQDGHYLLVQKAGSGDEHKLPVKGGTSATVYAELEFSPANDGTFVLRALPTFFTDSGMGTSSCLAGAIYGLNENRS